MRAFYSLPWYNQDARDLGNGRLLIYDRTVSYNAHGAQLLAMEKKAFSTLLDELSIPHDFYTVKGIGEENSDRTRIEMPACEITLHRFYDIEGIGITAETSPSYENGMVVETETLLRKYLIIQNHLHILHPILQRILWAITEEMKEDELKPWKDKITKYIQY